MSQANNKKIDQILEKLRWIQPDVFSLPVHSLEMSSGIHFISVKKIAYITSDIEEGISHKLKYVMCDGAIYYSNHRLSALDKILKDDPRFMRSQKSYIINFQQISRMEYSSARDLWFSDFEEPIINCVSIKKLDEFKTRFEDAMK
ncbi:MAG: LytTR family transcriptional regulator DNA-binding domain-containing protein [Flavobacteriaceae bacterium]|nr:LytTR family transcriptional regulator DNA-binding domain-containing protein [Flavobacteriaceae bacterium]